MIAHSFAPSQPALKLTGVFNLEDCFPKGRHFVLIDQTCVWGIIIDDGSELWKHEEKSSPSERVCMVSCPVVKKMRKRVVDIRSNLVPITMMQFLLAKSLGWPPEPKSATKILETSTRSKN